MALYQFECPNCYKQQSVRLAMEQRDSLVNCPHCSTQMKRQLGGYQIIGETFLDRPENKYAFGFSEGDRLKAYKEQDAMYDRTHPWRTKSQH